NTIDAGVLLSQASNVIISNNLFQNEQFCVYALGTAGNQFIAVISNTMGNVTFPTNGNGIFAQFVTDLKITQNTIQMVNSSLPIRIQVQVCDLCTIQGNNLWGGQIGVVVQNAGPVGTLVVQNTFHNCGTSAVVAQNVASSTIQIISNTIGECGLLLAGP